MPHPALANGETVKAAGTLQTKNGAIFIVNDSGHYQPRKKYVINSLKIMKEKLNEFGVKSSVNKKLLLPKN